jgi:hypothetical protein
VGRPSERLETRRDQREAVLLRGFTQLLVPAGQVELFAVRERQGTCEVHGVVCAQRVSAGALGRFGEERVGDAVGEDAAPDLIEVLECPFELGRGQAAALAHAGKGRGRLHVRDRHRADAVGLGVGPAGILGARLVDQQLDQRAGIEVEVQRRPSETYSAALLPVPWSLAGFVGR